MNKEEKLLEYLLEYVTEKRKKLFYDVIENRTNFLTIVLEDIFQPQNASAVLRTAECLGIQNLHIIENKNQYKLNPDVVLGANKWIDLHYYNKKEENNTLTCLAELKKQGYLIAATMPSTHDTFLTDYQLTQKTALIFGTEALGISEEAKKMADVFIKIPMYGFTESYNISVSAGISMFHLMHQLKESDIHWQLSDLEKSEILLKWVKGSVKKAKVLEKDFFEKLSL